MAEDIMKDTENTEAAESADNEAQEQGKDKEREKKKKEKKSKDKEELEKLAREFDEYKQAHLRVLAEYDNFRKRSMNEKTQIYNNAVSDTINAVLPVADNIDRALAQQNAGADDMRKGVEMISNQFGEVFSKLGITAVGEIGEKFDPALHNAVSHIENDELDESTISEIFQKGYKLGDKVVRHAMVQVAN